MTQTLVLRTPDDVLAAVPVVLGFEPADSVVMLTFGGRESFHARIDLPPPEEAGACAERLVAPARHHGVRGVVLVLYGAAGPVAARLARELERRFAAVGITVLGLMAVADGHWCRPLEPGTAPVALPRGAEDHPFRAAAVYDGRVVARSRDDLVDRLAPSVPQVDLVARAVRGATGTPLDGPGLRALLDVLRTEGRSACDAEAARILLALTRPGLRDHAWVGTTRSEAASHLPVWTDLVRRAPEGLVAGAAAVLGFLAWLHGDGALAWCAVDRCLADDPAHSLGTIVADLLEGAVPPSAATALTDAAAGIAR